jgi:hypothetical protein
VLYVVRYASSPVQPENEGWFAFVDAIEIATVGRSARAVKRQDGSPQIVVAALRKHLGVALAQILGPGLGIPDFEC